MNARPPFLTRPRRLLIARLVVTGVAMGLATVATAWLVRTLFDSTVSGAGAGPGLPATAALLCAIAAGSGLLRVRERIDAEELGQSWVWELRDALYRQLARAPERGAAARGHGNVLVRFTADMTAVRQWISLGLSRLVTAGLAVGIAIGVLVFIEPLLAGIVALIALFTAFGMFTLAPRVRDAIADSRRRRVQLVSTVTDTLNGLVTVRACGGDNRERRRLRRQGRRLWQAMCRRAAWNGALRGIGEAGTALAAAGAVVAGAWGVSQDQVTVGTVVAALAVISMLLPQFRQLGRVYEYWQAARVSLNNLDGQFARKPAMRAPRRGPDPASVRGELRFENVCVPGVLNGVSASLAAGDRVMLTGANGAGKSTLLMLVPRLFDPAHGCISLDGRDLRRWPLTTLRNVVSLASLDAPLLRGSLRRNLTYRKPDAGAVELAEVIALCGLKEFIDDLKRGLDTRIVNGGTNLSAGQRQRVILARALLGRPRVLLLDEPEAHLDDTTRTALNRVLDDNASTILMATHAPQRFRCMQRYWHLGQGRLTELQDAKCISDRTGSSGAASQALAV